MSLVYLMMYSLKHETRKYRAAAQRSIWMAAIETLKGIHICDVISHARRRSKEGRAHFNSTSSINDKSRDVAPLREA